MLKKNFTRIVNLFVDRRIWVRQILVAGLAGSTAWLVGDVIVTNGGLVAAIVCTLSIRISLHRSIREGLSLILGTAIGAAVALLTVTLFSFGFIAIGITIISCAVVARALHLGEVASMNVPVTALIVIGPGLNESTAAHRLYSTLIGAVIAIFFSYFSHPKTPVGRANDQISSLNRKAAQLLAKMSEGVAAGYTQKDAGNWLAKARLLVEEVPVIRAQSVEARGHARWFPTADKDEAEEIYIRGIAAEHTIVEVRTIARTLFDSAVSGGIADVTQKQIAAVLSAVSRALTAAAAEESTEASVTEDVRDAGVALTETFMEGVGEVDQDQLVRGLSIVANIQIIADSIDQSSPALKDVYTPDEPAAAKVISRAPSDPTRKIRKKLLKAFRKYF